MAKKQEIEVPTNIISGEPAQLPTGEPSKSEPQAAPVVNVDLKPFADVIATGFNSLGEKLTAALKPAPAAPIEIPAPVVVPPVVETPTPTKKSSGRIFDELDPSGLFEFGK